MKRLIPLLFLVAPLAAAAQTKSIEVLDPGTISLEISDAEKYNITDLTVSGALNGTDILYLVEMAGTTVYHDNEATAGILTHLDLSNARIVSGGAKYSQWPNYNTTDDVIGGNMFKHTILQRIVLPTTTTAIGENAFMECSSLEEIVVPEGVKSIGSYAFNRCNALRSVQLPEGIITLADATFMDCPALTSIVIPSTVTSIGGNVFNGCSITSLSLPAGVNSIGYDAFCHGLKELHVASTNVPMAGFRAFNSINTSECVLYVPKGTAAAYKVADQWNAFTHIVEEDVVVDALTSIEVSLKDAGTLADVLAGVDLSALTNLRVAGPINALDLGFMRELAGSDEYFRPTTGLVTSLDLEDATIVAAEDLAYAIHPYSDPSNPVYLTIWSTTMDANNMLPPMAFEGCHLEHIVLPRSLTTIASAFSGCPLQGTLVVPEGVTHIRDYAFQGCAQLEGIVLPSTLCDVGAADPYYPNALGTHVFEGCANLRAITLPAGVTTIPASAFEGAGLEEIFIPATVKSIANRAFASIPNMKRFVVESAEPPHAQYGAFDGGNFDTVELVVPDGATEAYRQAEEWCRFFGLDSPELPDAIHQITEGHKNETPAFDITGRKFRMGSGSTIGIDAYGKKIVGRL